MNGVLLWQTKQQKTQKQGHGKGAAGYISVVKLLKSEMGTNADRQRSTAATKAEMTTTTTSPGDNWIPFPVGLGVRRSLSCLGRDGVLQADVEIQYTFFR